MKKILIILSFLIIFLLYNCATIKTKEDISNEYYLIGNNYFELKNYEKAINCYLSSIEYNKKNQNSIINLIIAYQKSNKFELAENTILKYYTKKVNDFNLKLLFLLGNNFFLKNDYEKALKIYNEYLNLKPDDPDCYFNIGITYQRLKDNDSAFKYFFKSYNLKNDHKPALYNIAQYYYNKKQYQDALNYFLKLEKIELNNPEIYYKLSEIEFLIEEYEAAKTHILKAISLNKENNDYFILLARIYSKGFNDKNKTIEALENAFKNNFKNINQLKTYSEFALLFEYEEFKKLLKNYNLN